MSQKCVHKGCGKLFSDPNESPCVYHPGGPIFHEGQKGWRCCKPRVLTFDEFLSIPPCTTGEHSAVEEAPSHTPAKSAEQLEKERLAAEEAKAPVRKPITERTVPTAVPTPQEKKEEEVVDDNEEDDLAQEVKTGTTCRRRGCGVSYDGSKRSEKEEECVYHPGHPLFHEGSKGWTCCKRRVLEFDEFLKITGCNTKTRHLFSAPKKSEEEKVESIESIRNDFYQTSDSVIVSFYLKKIDKEKSSVTFSGPETIDFDLRTADGKHYVATVELYGETVPEENKFKILGTKLELTLKKADDSEGWPVLRKTDQHTGQIIQSGRAAMAA